MGTRAICRTTTLALEDPEFRNCAGIFSDKVFDVFHQFAKVNMTKGIPLLVVGGCGLNCDWNTKWKETNLFSEIFVPLLLTILVRLSAPRSTRSFKLLAI